MPAPSRVRLDYQHRVNMRPMSNFPLRVGWFLAMAPMVVGSLITLGYVLTWYDFLSIAGLFCIVGGMLSLLVGACVLARHWFEHRRRHLPVPKSLWLALVAMLVNFPACWICMQIGSRTMGINEVVVEDRTSAPIANVTITGTAPDGTTSTLAQTPLLSPGERLAWRVIPPNAGQINGNATVGNTPVSFAVEGYVSDGPVRHTITFGATTTQPTVRTDRGSH